MGSKWLGGHYNTGKIQINTISIKKYFQLLQQVEGGAPPTPLNAMAQLRPVLFSDVHQTKTSQVKYKYHFFGGFYFLKFNIKILSFVSIKTK
jgi:hypothetical protein